MIHVFWKMTPCRVADSCAVDFIFSVDCLTRQQSRGSVSSTLLGTFDVRVAVHRDKFLIIEPTRCTNFSKWWNILILLASCQQTCMTYTTAVCAVENSWWWTEELSETCRVLFQNKYFEKLVHLVGSIIRNFLVGVVARLYPSTGNPLVRLRCVLELYYR
jgi:hypothetical protein